MDVNLSKMVYSCWKCGSAGRAPKDWKQRLSLLSPLEERNAPLVPLPTNPGDVAVPPMMSAEIKRRGHEEAWIVHHYRAWWDGERISWPAGPSITRRAVLAWEQPKAITVAPRGKGLIGQHLLRPGAHVVITEGDWKSAAIPLPWVGVGLMGVIMSEEQEFILRTSNPASVTVMLDGGCMFQALNIRARMLPMQGRVVELPDGKGPDDIPRKELIRLLRES